LENVVEQKAVGICSTTFTRETFFKVEQNRLNKESIAPFQRSDVRVFADLFWSLRLVPLHFQR